MRPLSSTDLGWRPSRDASLAVNYRAIGISAVAAAIRYAGEARMPEPPRREDIQDLPPVDALPPETT